MKEFTLLTGIRRFRFLLPLLLIIVTSLKDLSAQTVTISVRNSKKETLPGAAVQLTRATDSVKFYGATDAKGSARFDNISNGLYGVKISFLGYQTLEKTINVKFEQKTFDFILAEDAISIDGVSITADRPLIRQEDDKMIIDPLPLANSSTNTLEVLEKVPGMYVDQDGGIYLSSTSAAVVYINGREQKMSNQDIATLLRSLPPGSVDRIEVLRTPSTKYDASSSGGIVNIILKKGVKLGRFGSISAGMNQGFYGNQFAGFTFNNSGDKGSSYLNLNYNHNDMLEELDADRELGIDTLLRQQARSRNTSHQAYLGYGMNYDLRDSLNLAWDGRVNLSFPDAGADNLNRIVSGEEIMLSESDNYIGNRGSFANVQQDLGLVKKFDSLGSEIDTKLGYNFNYNLGKQDYETRFTSPILYTLAGEGENLQQRHLGVLQSDLTWYFPYRIKLESGIKSSYQYYKSSADYYFKQGDSLTEDASRTNAFEYSENINAAYAQASKTIGKKFIIKAGLRMEHTYMNGHQSIPADTSFLIKRVDFFPYIYLSRGLFTIADVEITAYAIYRRTITRPDYGSLNPYKKYIDPYLYESGNPALKPQFTHNIELNVSFDDTPLFAVGQNYTTDIFTNVVYPDADIPAIAVRTFDNLGKSVETYVRAIAGIPPGKRYFFAIGGQYNHNTYDGYYNNEPLKYSHDSWRIFTYHSLKLFKGSKLSLMGFMMINGQMGFYELGNFGMLNLNLSQQLFDNKLTIALSARDILRTMAVRFELNQGNIMTSGERYTDNQRFGINIRYNFGMKSKDDKKGFMDFNTDE